MLAALAVAALAAPATSALREAAINPKPREPTFAATPSQKIVPLSRKPLTGAEKADIAAKLRAHPLQAAAPDLDSNYKTIPFVKHDETLASSDIYVNINFGDSGNGDYNTSTLVDTGNHVLIMDSFDQLKAVQPSVQIIRSGTEPWGHSAHFVQGKFSISTAGGGVLTLEAQFWACTEAGCMNNIGLANGWDSQSPLMNQPSIDYVTFDYQQKQMLLNPEYDCPSWMGIDDRSGMIWPFVYIDELDVNGVRTEWAKGKDGPPQYWRNPGTMGMFDTGGGPIFLATQNIPIPNSGLPKPQGTGQCSAFYSWANETPCSPDCLNGGACPQYCGCECYYGDVAFKLESADSSVTKEINLTNADVAKGEAGVPTFIGCDKANLGGGDYANLGGVMFDLHKITMGVNSHKVCIEDLP